MKPILSIVTVILLTTGCANYQPTDSDAVTPDMLMKGFTNPPDSVKPWVYWYWISDNNTREGYCDGSMADVGYEKPDRKYFECMPMEPAFARWCR
jgi:hypothetical protein